MFITGFAAVALTPITRSAQAKKPFETLPSEDLVNEVQRLLAA